MDGRGMLGYPAFMASQSPIYPWMQQFQPNSPMQMMSRAEQVHLPLQTQRVQNDKENRGDPSQDDKKEKRTRERWSKTEEKLLIDLYGERARELRYKAYNSQEWVKLCHDLKSKCNQQDIICLKTPQQCKQKLNQLTKKYKETKDKLNQTGYGKDEDNTEGQENSLFPSHFDEMDEILGSKESVAPSHVLESSFVEEDKEVQVENGDNFSESSDDGELEKLENRRLASALPKKKEQKARKSTKRGSSESNLKTKEKRSKMSKESDDIYIDFLEKSQEREEEFMLKMMQMEKEHQERQQKFNLDALALLTKSLKDISSASNN